jgi:hypothetical protein
MIGVALHVAERRGAERAPTSAARPARRAEASCLRSSRPSTTVRFRKHARLPHSGKARIWGRPQARTSAKCEEHLRVGAGREAEAEEVTAEQIVKRVFEVVEVP